MTTGQQVKIVMVGDTYVGKTCLVGLYESTIFGSAYKQTIGVEYRSIEKKIDGKEVTLQVWDTAGQETFKTIAPLYYRFSNIILIVYDISSRKTFEHIDQWIEEISHVLDIKTIVLTIVGNKIDKRTTKCGEEEDGREFITTEEGERKAKQYGALFCETSAKTDLNVEECFDRSVSVLLASDRLEFVEDLEELDMLKFDQHEEYQICTEGQKDTKIKGNPPKTTKKNGCC